MGNKGYTLFSPCKIKLMPSVSGIKLRSGLCQQSLKKNKGQLNFSAEGSGRLSWDRRGRVKFPGLPELSVCRQGRSFPAWSRCLFTQATLKQTHPLSWMARDNLTINLCDSPFSRFFVLTLIIAHCFGIADFSKKRHYGVYYECTEYRNFIS